MQIRPARLLASALVFGSSLLWTSAGLAQVLAVSPATGTLTIHPGDSNVLLPVSLSGGAPNLGPVSVTLTGLPSGVSVAPLTLASGGSGTLQISASVSADQESFPANDPTNADTATSTVTVLAFSGTTQATAPLTLTVSLENPGYSPAANQINLPIVRIDTGGVAIVDKTTDVPGTVTITSGDGQTSYLPGSAGSDNTATFHLHGNTTILLPKKPYKIKLNTSTDLLTSMGLHCPYVTSSGKAVCDKSKSYILLANYTDKSMLRDWAASALANAIPMGGSYLTSPVGSPSPSGTAAVLPWAPHSLFVEVYLNGEYEGTYQLIEEVKVDSHRVNINEMSATNVSGSALTGGYLMEIDQRQAEDFNFVTPQGVDVGLDDPDFSPEVPEQTTYINNYVVAAENALFSNTYTDPVTGWPAYYDLAAAVNYYIVNDLLGNYDAGRFYSSTYLYKDKSNPLLYMGPVWDFDISAGNDRGTLIQDPTSPWMQVQSPWYARLFSDPQFTAATAQQWNALKNNGVFAAWLASVAQQGTALTQTQKNNFGRWPVQGVLTWPNSRISGTYAGDVDDLVSWVTLRMGYLDGVFNSKPAAQVSLYLVPGTHRSGSPITLTAQVTGNHPTGSVTFAYNSIPLGEAPLDSSGAATLTTSTYPPGFYYVEGYYNGDANNGIGVAVGSGDFILAPLVSTITNLSSSGTASDYGSAVTMTAVVVGNSGGVPSGSVTFSSNGSMLGSAPLSGSGVAAFSTTSLPAGSTAVQAVYSGDTNFMQSSSNSLNVSVNGLATTLSFAAVPAHTFGDAAFTVSATSDSAGAVSYAVLSGPANIAGNLLTLTGAGTIVLSASQEASGNYAAASAQLSFTVAPAIPQLAFAAIANHTFGDAAFTVSAASASTATVTYAVVSGPATIAGNLVTITGAGQILLSASQAASSNYTAASAQLNFTVGPAIPQLAFAAIANHTFGDAAFPVSAASASTGTVTYAVVSGPATIEGNLVTISGAGQVMLSASQAAQGSYSAATAQTGFSVGPAAATLTFSAIAAHTFGDAPFTVSASSESGGAITYALLLGPATLSGNVVTITGGGMVTLAATQAAAGNYAAAAVQTTFAVAPATPSLSFATIGAHTYGDPAFAVSTTSTSTGAVTYSVASGPASVSGSTVTITGAGTVTMSASQAATANYTATTASTSFAVTRQATSLALSASGTALVPAQNVTFTAAVAPASIGSPTGTVTFFLDGASSGTAVALSNATAAFSTAGLLSGAHTVTATYSGDTSFLASSSAGPALTVAPLDFSVATMGGATQTVKAGSAASFSLQVAPTYGTYPGPVSFGVTGLPAGATASFSPSSLAVGDGAKTVTLTIQTTATTAQRSGALGTGLVAFGFMLLPWANARRIRRGGYRMLTLLIVLAGCAAASAVSGCGMETTTGAATPQNYSMTVITSSGSVQHSTSEVLTVQ